MSVNEYSALPDEEKMRIYETAMKYREQYGWGQRKISRHLEKKANVTVPEPTVAGWIYRGVVPERKKHNQFKPKPRPSKEKLRELYIEQGKSGDAIAQELGITGNTVRKWVKEYGIEVRNHKESMNTAHVQEQLRKQKLRKPKKEYNQLTIPKAYILGVLCGDGHINENFIRFEIRRDEEFIQKFSHCIEEVYGLQYEYKFYPPRKSFVLYIASHIICKDLLSYGVFEHSSWTVPDKIMNHTDKDIICSFLQGFYDSDGWPGQYSVIAASNNQQGLNDVKKLLTSLGFQPTLTDRERFYALYITGKNHIHQFKRKIGFTVKRRKKKLENMYEEW